MIFKKNCPFTFFNKGEGGTVPTMESKANESRKHDHTNKILEPDSKEMKVTLQIKLLCIKISNRLYSELHINWGEWPSGLRHWIRIGRFLVQTPLDTQPGLGAQPRYKTPQWPLGWICKTQWLTLGELGCFLDNGPRVAVGQPNCS